MSNRRIVVVLILLALVGVTSVSIYSFTHRTTNEARWEACVQQALRAIPGKRRSYHEFPSLGNEGGFPGETIVYGDTSIGYFKQSIYYERSFFNYPSLLRVRCWLPNRPVRVSKVEFEQQKP